MVSSISSMSEFEKKRLNLGRLAFERSFFKTLAKPFLEVSCIAIRFKSAKSFKSLAALGFKRQFTLYLLL